MELSNPNIDELIVADTLASSIAKTIVALAYDDGVLTVDEYAIIASLGAPLADWTGSQMLANCILLHYLQSPPPLSDAVKTLGRHSKTLTGPQREALYDWLTQFGSVLKIDQAHLTTIGRSLGVVEDKLSSLRFMTDMAKTVGGAASLLRRPSSRTQAIKRFLTVYGKNTALEAFASVERDADIKSEHEALWVVTRDEIISDLARLELVREQLKEKRATQSRLLEMGEMFVGQLQQRVRYFAKHVDRISASFEDDVNTFLRSAASEAGTALRDRVVGGDYSRQDIWDVFGRDHAALVLRDRFEALQRRYARFAEELEEELNDFAGEAVVARERFGRVLGRNEFAEMIPGRSLGFKALTLADGASEAVLGTATLAALGTAVAMAAGATVSFSALLTPPGLIVLGVVGVAAVYKSIAHPLSRINVEVDAKVKAITIELRKALGDPSEQYANKMKALKDRFFAVVADKYAPIVVDIKLSDRYLSSQEEALTAIASRTIKDLNRI